MDEQSHKAQAEEQPKRGDPGEAAAAPEEEQEAIPNQPQPTRPLIDPTVLRIIGELPPLVDPAVFDATNTLQSQAAEIARVVAPLTQSLNLNLAESITHAWPKIDLTPLLPTLDVTQLLPKFDLSALMPDFRALLEDLRRHEPPNWPPGIDLHRFVEVIRDDGLPGVGAAGRARPAGARRR